MGVLLVFFGLLLYLVLVLIVVYFFILYVLLFTIRFVFDLCLRWTLIWFIIVLLSAKTLCVAWYADTVECSVWLFLGFRFVLLGFSLYISADDCFKGLWIWCWLCCYCGLWFGLLLINCTVDLLWLEFVLRWCLLMVSLCVLLLICSCYSCCVWFELFALTCDGFALRLLNCLVIGICYFVVAYFLLPVVWTALLGCLGTWCLRVVCWGCLI